MKRLLERTFVVEAAAEQAWAELLAAEQWPRWAQHLGSVQVTPPGRVGPGSRATLRLKNRTKASVRVTEFEDGRRFRWEGSFLWMGLGYDHLVTTDEVGRVSITFVVEGAGVGINTIGPRFASSYARNLDRAIPRLQALLGSADRARPSSGWFFMAGMRGSPTTCRLVTGYRASHSSHAEARERGNGRPDSTDLQLSSLLMPRRVP